MATRCLWLTSVAVGRTEVILAQTRKPAPVLSARSVFGTRHPGSARPFCHPEAPPQPSPAPACQRAAPCFGARRAYLTLAPLSRLTNDECSGSALAAASSPPSCPGCNFRVGPSFKELGKITIRRTLCQVCRRRLVRNHCLWIRSICGGSDPTLPSRGIDNLHSVTNLFSIYSIYSARNRG